MINTVATRHTLRENQSAEKKGPTCAAGLLGGLSHSPRLHNAVPIIWFPGAEMHFLRGASADISCLRGNHLGSTSLWGRTIERRRHREPPGRRHGGIGSAVLETPSFDRVSTRGEDHVDPPCMPVPP